jgi:transcription-repair coupling factor (superfamily II helicase)
MLKQTASDPHPSQNSSSDAQADSSADLVLPIGAVASELHRRVGHDHASPILYIARNTARAEALTDHLKLFGGELTAAVFPRWDGSAADAIPPSAQAMGRRMSVLRWLLDRENRPRVIVATPEAVLRRVPPRSIWKSIHLEFRPGDRIEPEDVQSRLEAIGYRFDERVDEPGEAVLRGLVIEVFPAAAPRPCRIEIAEGQIVDIRSYDPLTQRSVHDVEQLIVDPASETFAAPGEAPEAGQSARETLFDYLDDAELLIEERAGQRGLDVLSALEEAEGAAVLLSETEWRAKVKDADVAPSTSGKRSDIPHFARERDPLGAFRRFIEPLKKSNYRIVLAGAEGQVLRLWGRRLERALGGKLTPVQDWEAVRAASPDQPSLLAGPVEQGFLDHNEKIACIALRDLAGQAAGPRSRGFAVSQLVDTHLRFGDVVVHLEYGLGVLEGLETTGDGEGEAEVLRLRYADDAVLLVPLGDIGLIWRYGGPEADVALDRLKGGGWIKRRDETMKAIAETAKRMVHALEERSKRRAKPLRPDRLQFERFCASFPFALTDDQAAAAEAVADDLAAGRPMDRLLCGDVGFGKTEIALRAAAAAVFAGRQAAIVAPTTVLARQHFDVFRRRFARHGVEVAMLSRLNTATEAKAVKAGLADGSIRVVVATHAICGKDVTFDDLALVVVDEEQRFGSRHKKIMRSLAPDLHFLSMTATPIPRTLQAGFIGLTDLSVIATPPRRRLPVRTARVPFTAETVGKALLAERARGGQSFVVCPRIEDLEPIARRLQDMVPQLSRIVLHGAMKPAEVDKAMLDFAAGKGDILLATNIIESGLDVPAANTMIVYNPDRFGLSQLHQLRGRVGRGVQRATMLMTLDPDAELSDNAQRRLEVLEELSSLGAGFDISSRDLDIRGAGELLGDEQAGHLQAIGVALYRRLLEHALAEVQGQNKNQHQRADVELGITFAIPATYIPQPELRIELAAALDRVEDEAALEAIRADFSDRFGEIPPELQIGFNLAALRLRATMLGIRKLDGGPKAIAATLSRSKRAEVKKRIASLKDEALCWSRDRLILQRETDGVDARLQAAECLLDSIA